MLIPNKNFYKKRKFLIIKIHINYFKTIFLICLLKVIITTNPTDGLLLDSSVSVGTIGSGTSAGGSIYLDKNGNLEKSLAAVFNKVAYGSTTTKRSIPDNVFVPSLTTVPTPLLTTYRYRERDKDSTHDQQQYQSSLGSDSSKYSHNRNYETELERDHVLPTSAPNAEILKSNSNPTYPNPNRHHNHERERHRHSQNSTPMPSGHNLKKLPTPPMFPVDMPSYSPPSRALLSPPLPQNPFADKPTLRGTNSDSSIVNAGTFTNRRPIPPPSLTPGHERIPLRPPDLVSSKISIGSGAPPDQPSIALSNLDSQRKKVLNTPSHKMSPSNVGGNYNKDQEFNIKLDNSSESLPKSGGIHFPSISRILSGSNGRKEDIPEVLLRTVTVRPSILPSSPSISPLNNYNGDSLNNNGNDYEQYGNRNLDSNSNNDDDMDDDEDDEDVDDLIDDFNYNKNLEEPKTQPKIKSGTEHPKNKNNNSNHPNNNHNIEDNNGGGIVYSTQVIHKLENSQHTTTQSLLESDRNRGMGSVTASGSGGYHHTSSPSSKIPTWSVAWNIHVYLSAILFTVLAVYSIFKMIFYDKLTHLFNQSYFICIHLILIIICLSRIFYLCYDAYNIHLSFNNFLSEILLNIPSTLLTVTFSILVLFLLIKSLNNKNNRYSAVMRPLTIVIGCSVHICLCITLHYVENKQNQLIYNRRQATSTLSGGHHSNHNNNNIYNHPPRVLSLICQIIYIFICLSLGFLYLYLYRILKRVLRNKSQNYIHGYQNLSYAIHITIATALLFILLASLQIYGAISISTIRPLISNLNSDIDWLQWGYQFSLRLIEIAIITLLSWVTGLKTGASKVMQREKEVETHNVSGFALFPCTSSSSQEHFDTDYPAVCNANTNLHTYTLRTGKALYDDNFALNPVGNAASSCNIDNAGTQDFPRQYETNSTRSSMHNSDRIQQSSSSSHNHQNDDCLNDSGTVPDHYENPNFELRSNSAGGNNLNNKNDVILDNCYSEPINNHQIGVVAVNNNNNNNNNSACSSNIVSQLHQPNNYDFQNFERPNFDRPNSRNEFRASKNLKAMKNNNSNNLERGLYENPERRSSNSNHSYGSSRNFSNYNNSSFERRGVGGDGTSGVRKSGTLNNIGGMHNGRSNQNQIIVANRASGVHTLSSSRSQDHHNLHNKNNPKLTASNNKKERAWMGGGGVANQQNPGGLVEMTQERNSIGPLNGTSNTNNYMMNEDEFLKNFENSSMSGGSDGGSGISRPPYHPSHDRVHYNSKQQHLLDQRGSLHHESSDPQQSSSGDSTTSGSMLVAEHGFVRFRALDDIGLSQLQANQSQQQQQQPQIMRTSGRRDIIVGNNSVITNQNNMHVMIGGGGNNDKRFTNT